MSLRVWLPLNGDLHNLGLSNISVINNGATVDNNGKLGKCYNFNNGHFISSTVNIASSPISASVWIYLNSFHDQWNYVLSLNNNSGYVDQCIAITLESAVGICFCAGGNSSLKYTHTETLVGKWTHLAVTFDGNTIKGYVNGINVCSLASTAKLTRTNFTLGSRNGTSDYYLNGKLNDIRLYDHCLSPEEVHEISKGLVLHYLMNDHAIAMSKCKNVVWNQLLYIRSTSISRTENGVTVVDHRDGSYTISTDENGSTAPTNYWIGSFNNLTTTNNHKVYIRNGADVSNKISVGFGSNGKYAENTGSIVTGGFGTFGFVVKNNQVITNPITIKPQVFDLTLMFGAGNEPSTVQEFENMFPEPYYPYYPNESGIVTDLSEPLYDCSGYCYNGTINGTLTLDNTTPRYQKCTVFNSNNQSYIEPNGINVSNATELSVCCWAKPTTNSLSFLWGMNYDGSLQFSTRTDNSLGVRDNGGDTLYKYSLGDVTPNQWTYLCCTYNKGTVKIYRDGILLSTNTTGGNILNDIINNYFVGQSQNVDGRRFNGNISDFRIFTTALSEADIQDLYALGALITE